MDGGDTTAAGVDETETTSELRMIFGEEAVMRDLLDEEEIGGQNGLHEIVADNWGKHI